MSSSEASKSEVKGTNLAETAVMKRLGSLDFQRGLAIFLMVFLHSIQHLYDIGWATNIDQLLQMNVLVILSVVLMAFLSGWAGYFLIISAIVNSLAMCKRALRGHRPIQILLKQVLNGLGILFAAVLTDGWFGYYGYLGKGLRTGNWTTQSFLQTAIGRSFFMMETLHTIGWCMIITAIVQFLMIRNGGYKKTKRNIIIFAILVVVIIAVSPLIWNWSDNMNWGGYYNFSITTNVGIHRKYFTSFRWPSETDQFRIGTFKASFFTLLAGDLEPLFPFLSTSFLGALIGTILGKEDNPPKRLPFYGAMTALSFIALGGILIAVGLPFDFTWFRPTMTYFLILMGAWVGLISFILYKVEYRGNPEKFANKKMVRFMRLWGMISLSIFSLQIFSLFPRWILSFLLTDINLVNQKLPFGQEGYVLLICIYIVFTYHLLVKLWSKVNFKFSFEWFIIRFANIGSKRDVYSKLNTDIIMNKIEWMDYKREELYRTSALILCIFFGFLGMHRFYIGKKKFGFIYLFTGGLLFGGVIYDIVQIIRGKEPFAMKW